MSDPIEVSRLQLVYLDLGHFDAEGQKWMHKDAIVK